MVVSLSLLYHLWRLCLHISGMISVSSWRNITPQRRELLLYIHIYIYLTNYIFRLCLLLCHRAANKLQYLVILNQLQIYHKIITITRRDEGPCRATTLWWIISLEKIIKMIQILEILILLVNNGFNIRNAKKHKLRGEIIF